MKQRNLALISLLLLTVYCAGNYTQANGPLGPIEAEEGNNEQFCHDLETGEYREIREGDTPTPMKPHSGEHEKFEEPHLSCTPSSENDQA